MGFNFNKYDKQHDRNLTKYVKKMEDIYAAAAKEAAGMSSLVKGLSPDKMFSFDDFPATKKRIDKLLEELHSSITTAIVNGVRAEWTLANNKNNELSNWIFGQKAEQLSEEAKKRYFGKNSTALEAFEKRTQNGLNLSDRVWKYTDMFKEEIEMGLDIGIRDGVPAAEMARDLKKYLQHPDMLFRRVRDAHGNLVLSQRAKTYHPGQGVYRSSYMNARRLAATETNIAYRTADHLRWKDMDFVVGIEVKLSNNHNCKGIPVGQFADICDDLAGEYPKEFKFTGWHPHCRCHAEPILKSEEEMDRDTERILNGEEPLEESENTVEDVPKDFEGWIKNNASRIVRANQLPLFMTDNAKRVSDIMNRHYPNTVIEKQMQRTANFDWYVLKFKQSSDKVKALLSEYEKQTTDMGKAMIINQVKQECANLTYQDLLSNGQIGNDWVLAKKNFESVIQPKQTLLTTNGKLVSLEETKLDLLIFKDGSGREFAYPVGAGKDLFSAKTASETINEFPPYLSKGIKRVSFLNCACPTDPYWQVEYNNPNHQSMATDGGRTTFYMTPQGKSDFKGYMAHEAGHIIDGANHRFSSHKGWKEACEKDKTLRVNAHRVSKYAETNDSENFAECMRAYINDHELFKNMYPNCAAYIRQMAQKLSGHFKTP